MSDAEDRAFALLTSLVRREAFDFEAVRELSALGEAAVPALEAQLAIDDPRARKLAVRTLAAIGARSGIATLLNLASTERDADPELVALALRGATSALAPKDAEKVTALYVSFASHEDSFVRAAAADGLGKVEAKVPRVLLRLASDEDEFVAERARQALGENASSLESDSSADEAGPLRPGDLDLLTGLASRTPSERLSAIQKIVASRDGSETINRLLPGEDHRMIRVALLEAAQHLRHVGTYDVLRTIIEDPDARDGERSLAFRALAVPERVSDRELAAMVERFGRTRDPLERAAAATFGMQSGRAAVVEVAVAKLKDRDAHVRGSTAKAFRDAPAGPAVPAVIHRVHDISTSKFPSSDNLDEWASLVEGLVRFERDGGFVGADAAYAMLDAMRDGPEAIRGVAADAFLRFAQPGGVPSRTKAEAAEALFSSGRIDNALELLADDGADVDYAVPALVKALYRANADETVAIARLLTRSDLPAATGAVARLRAHADSRVRTAVQPSGRAEAPAAPADEPRAENAAPTSGPVNRVNPPSPEGSDRPSARPGGEKMGTSERTKPPMANIPEDAPLLLQEPPSTFLPSTPSADPASPEDTDQDGGEDS